MSPPFSLINVLSSSQMEVTSEEQIWPENCAQHEPKTEVDMLQRTMCNDKSLRLLT